MCLFTYSVPPELLLHRLPPGLELDERDGKHFVSLVAFHFLNTRVFGVSWPGYRNFPELNLRTYVRRGNRRGVLFLREIVRQRLICWVATALYNEPYAPAPLEHRVEAQRGDLSVAGFVSWGGRDHSWRLHAENRPWLPPESSVEHFFKEHQWGYGVDRKGRCLEYGVAHPMWRVYPVTHYHLDFDFGQVYGREFAFLAASAPESVIFAEGSAVQVFPAHREKGKRVDSSGEEEPTRSGG